MSWSSEGFTPKRTFLRHEVSDYLDEIASAVKYLHRQRVSQISSVIPYTCSRNNGPKRRERSEYDVPSNFTESIPSSGVLC